MKRGNIEDKKVWLESVGIKFPSDEPEDIEISAGVETLRLMLKQSKEQQDYHLKMQVKAEMERDPLRAAAQAVVERWDTPSWKDVEATASYINRLREALK